MDIFDSINMLRVAAAEASRGFRPDMKKAAAFNDGADALEFMLRFKQKLDDTYAEAKEITKNVKILLNEKTFAPSVNIVIGATQNVMIVRIIGISKGENNEY